MKTRPCISVLTALWFGTLPSFAASVQVANPSFESPYITASPPYYSLITQDNSVITGQWLSYGGFAAVVEDGRYGVSHTGTVGTQIGDQIGKPAVGVFQDIAAYDGSGLADQYWQAGYTYTMTVGIGTRSDNPVAGSS